MKLSVYVWACRSQGVEPDLEGFVRTHRVHTQPRKIQVDGKPVAGQFGVYTFCYRHGAEVPVQAQKNKWASSWTVYWFYCKLSGELELCGDMPRLGNVSAEAVMTDGCQAAVDALRVLARHQCTRDLVEEFLCAKVGPLKADQRWFVVKEDARYRDRGLKGLEIDVKKAWSKVLGKGNTHATGVKAVYKEVAEATEELVGSLGTTESKAIRAALTDRHRLNRLYDLLGLTYPDWLLREPTDVGGSKAGATKKRKRVEVTDTAVSASKRGGLGVTVPSARNVVSKVPASRVEPVAGPVRAAPVFLPAAAGGGARPPRRMASILDVPVLNIVSDDDEDEEEEGEGRRAGGDKPKDSSSSSDRDGSDGSEDEDDEEEEEEGDGSENAPDAESFDVDGGDDEDAQDHEVASQTRDERSMPRRRRIHVFRDGHEVDTDEDVEGPVGKRTLGDASRSSLVHFGSTLGTDEAEVELFTSPGPSCVSSSW